MSDGPGGDGPPDRGPGSAHDSLPEDMLDHGLVLPLAIPPDSLVPDPVTGLSNPAEYDLYFRMARENPGLLAWSRSCLRIDVELLDDLQRTGLSAEDRCQILQGLLTVHRVTLERWVALAETAVATPAAADATVGGEDEPQ